MLPVDRLSKSLDFKGTLTKKTEATVTDFEWLIFYETNRNKLRNKNEHSLKMELDASKFRHTTVHFFIC